MDYWTIIWWAMGQAFKYGTPAVSFFNKGLDTAKNATDTIASIKNLLPEPKDDETSPDDIAERIYAVSSLTRSYALFGFLELLLWIWKGIVIYVALTKAHEWIARKK